MASSLAMGTALRDLRDLFGDGTTVGLGDARLLARYADAGDESAFAALVARHGPMVLATCRAVLKHDHDVDDAFQATFMVLARKARSVRDADALGGWLHRVAYRASIHARDASRRRSHREAEAAALAPLHSTLDDLSVAADVAAVVHEAVERLPEKHRLPVVLCDLEGLAYEQAAERLGWTLPTLRCRLAKARRLLQARLVRQGIAPLAVAGILAAQAAQAKEAVPAALARSTLTAAAGGTTSATVASLSAALSRGLALARLKAASAGVLAAIALATSGLVAVGALRPDPAGLAMAPPPDAASERPKAARELQPAPSADRIEVRGLVLDPKGRPVAGAAVRTYSIGQDDRFTAKTTSGPDGRFQLRVRSWGINSLMRTGDMYPWVIASAPGFGPGWASALPQPGAPAETTVRLVEEGPPIEGRIVDLEGRPAANARVRVETLWFAREGGVSPWLDRVRGTAIEGPWRGLQQFPVSISTDTDPDGRFRLMGIGPERIAQIFITGPTFTTTQVYVASRDGEAIRTANPFAGVGGTSGITYYPRRFELAAGPARPIEGTIRDKDTGRPIAGLTIRGRVEVAGNLIWTPGIEAKTDDLGHYRLNGLSGAPSYRLFIEPGPGQPYTRATFVTPEGPSGPGPVAFDIAMKRGVLVRGRVTDKADGRPVSGYVHAFTFADNPHADEFPGYVGSQHTYVLIEEDGRYQIAVPPGRGIIACSSDSGRYLQGIGASTIRGYDPKVRDGGLRTRQGGCRCDGYHVVAEIDPDPKAETTTLDLQVDPGRSLTIHAVDPEGRPLAGTRAAGLGPESSVSTYEQDSPTIEVHALETSQPRRVTITHEGRKLAGSIYLKGDETGPLTVRLQPSGTVTGRIVDEDGLPRGGLELTDIGGFSEEPPPDRAKLPAGDSRPEMVVGGDGRFRLEGLTPGLKYGAGAVRGLVHLGDLFRDVTVEPGEVKDLGDLKITPSQD
ncbi:sigma-70 family RNA polymerase sigma factor [Singulisphaera sp. PoT]|uniref:sigma-70 family RNA polymerase sigma factor n=1 Tax=Singulisphaera sp. PoT TaxID=3411797 RepID=UPI003BF5DCCE